LIFSFKKCSDISKKPKSFIMSTLNKKERLWKIATFNVCWMLFSSAVNSIKAPLARHYAFSTRPVNIKKNSRLELQTKHIRNWDKIKKEEKKWKIIFLRGNLLSDLIELRWWATKSQKKKFLRGEWKSE